MHRIAPTAVLLLLLPACSHNIPYPATAAGQTLRAFYTAPGEIPGDIQTALGDEQKVSRADRIALQPAMLAIIRHDHSERGLMVAYILADWNLELAATAPEFRRLLPVIAKGLDAPNGDRALWSTRWTAAGSTILLSHMGADAVRSIRDAIARRLNAPVASPIVGESSESWTRFILAGILCSLGTDGIPGLALALHHPDPFIRQCVLEALGYYYDPEEEADARETAVADRQKLPAWYTPAWQAKTSHELRALAPDVLEIVAGSDPGTAQLAIQSMPYFFTSDTLTQLAQSSPNLKIRSAAISALKKQAKEMKTRSRPDTQP